MRILKYFVFIVYCSVPFLGGNHLPLHYITIDRFWIENIFLLSLIASMVLLFLNRKDADPYMWKKFFLFFMLRPGSGDADCFERQARGLFSQLPAPEQEIADVFRYLLKTGSNTVFFIDRGAEAVERDRQALKP